MNTYLLGLISKWTGIVCLSVTGLFSGSLISEEKIEVDNTNQTKNTVTQITNLTHETKTIYNKSMPKDTKVTKTEGHDGLAYTDDQNKTIEVIEQPEPAIIEVGTGEEGKFVGKMTGYGADCAGCSGTLSCKTKQGSYWNLRTNGENYTDDTYGKVRIIAAALSKFPCGTIIEVKNPNLGTFNAIVLDTGGAMRTAWNNGIVHMDLAYISETSSGINLSTSSNVEYNVKRWGW